MKKFLMQLIIVISAACLFASCKEKTENSIGQEYSVTSHPAPVEVQEKLNFNGRFEGATNQTNYRLNLMNKNGEISGAMKDGENSFLLNGKIINEKVIGSLKYAIGDMPFEAYYNGNSLVMQLDKETMDAWKLIIAVATEDANVLLSDDKIVFDQTL